MRGFGGLVRLDLARLQKPSLARRPEGTGRMIPRCFFPSDSGAMQMFLNQIDTRRVQIRMDFGNTIRAACADFGIQRIAPGHAPGHPHDCEDSP